MASVTNRAFGSVSPFALTMAFVERQTNLWKRYWAWELVWLVYGVVNTVAITLIAEQVGGVGADVRALVLFLLIGTLVWAYLSAVLDDISLVIQWERWEGTIEHTLMAPVPRSLHLLGMSVFGILHGLIRTLLIFAIALLFFDIDFGNVNIAATVAVVLVGSVSVAALAILAGLLPLLYPERGGQMSMMIQASLLLISGVYYEVEVLPAWLQAFSFISPATYMLEGIRGSMIEGQGLLDVADTLGILALFGVIMVPMSLWAFNWAESYAKRTGKLKRMG
ncbi:MAG: ABC transporter permease [Chloroflexi bacterium]|nr:ABC transporter permease [Chloroflexota bacterium]